MDVDMHNHAHELKEGAYRAKFQQYSPELGSPDLQQNHQTIP
jgi:hypothetical protein